MGNQLWSWVLTAVGVFGLYLAGRRSRWGWAVGIGAQVLWFAYAIATRQWGFVVSCFAYGSVYARNFLRWRREQLDAHRETREATETVGDRVEQVLIHEAEARGYALSVARLRDDERYRDWWTASDRADPDGMAYWKAGPRNHLADYLETVGPGQPGGDTRA